MTYTIHYPDLCIFLPNLPKMFFEFLKKIVMTAAGFSLLLFLFRNATYKSYDYLSLFRPQRQYDPV